MTQASRPTLLEETLSFVPPDPYFPVRVPGYSPPDPLLRFHDTHLDNNLVLKGICVLPSLLTDILKSVDTLFPTDSHSRYSEETFFFDERIYRKLDESFKGSDVAEVYIKGVARSACQIASSVLIHPDEPTEARTILWTESPHIYNEDDPPFFEENIVLRMWDFTEERLGKFSPDNRKRICSIQEKFPIIALGVFYVRTLDGA
ncbi:hypothetical protein BDZ89DRAFT_371278 [Hymenopellis radicata]|nr:hypothetical protein BDZ89DRAFT_371278 [Hymenopellis radicata]